MRPVCAPLLVAVALWPRPALPQGEPAPSAPRLTTTVEGTVPDLTGRWLMVANVSLEGQQPQEQRQTAPIAYGWEVTVGDGKPQLAFRWGGLPPALMTVLRRPLARLRSTAPSLCGFPRAEARTAHCAAW